MDGHAEEHAREINRLEDQADQIAEEMDNWQKMPQPGQGGAQGEEDQGAPGSGAQDGDRPNPDDAGSPDERGGTEPDARQGG